MVQSLVFVGLFGAATLAAPVRDWWNPFEQGGQGYDPVAVGVAVGGGRSQGYSEKRIALYCDGPGYTGDCISQEYATYECTRVAPAFRNNILSFSTEPGTCVLYGGDDCTGFSVPVYSPASSLYHFPGAGSYRCYPFGYLSPAVDLSFGSDSRPRTTHYVTETTTDTVYLGQPTDLAYAAVVTATPSPALLDGHRIHYVTVTVIDTKYLDDPPTPTPTVNSQATAQTVLPLAVHLGGNSGPVPPISSDPAHESNQPPSTNPAPPARTPDASATLQRVTPTFHLPGYVADAPSSGRSTSSVPIASGYPSGPPPGQSGSPYSVPSTINGTPPSSLGNPASPASHPAVPGSPSHSVPVVPESDSHPTILNPTSQNAPLLGGLFGPSSSSPQNATPSHQAAPIGVNGASQSSHVDAASSPTGPLHPPAAPPSYPDAATGAPAATSPHSPPPLSTILSPVSAPSAPDTPVLASNNKLPNDLAAASTATASSSAVSSRIDGVGPQSTPSSPADTGRQLDHPPLLGLPGRPGDANGAPSSRPSIAPGIIPDSLASKLPLLVGTISSGERAPDISIAAPAATGTPGSSAPGPINGASSPIVSTAGLAPSRGSFPGQGTPSYPANGLTSAVGPTPTGPIAYSAPTPLATTSSTISNTPPLVTPPPTPTTTGDASGTDTGTSHYDETTTEEEIITHYLTQVVTAPTSVVDDIDLEDEDGEPAPTITPPPVLAGPASSTGASNDDAETTEEEIEYITSTAAHIHHVRPSARPKAPKKKKGT